MSNSHQTQIQMEETFPLKTCPGSGGDTQNNKCSEVICSTAASCCDDKNHRKLAICSIICGLSCIGIMALIHSVKAEKTADPKTAAVYSQRAKKYGITSIVIWVSILVLTPGLMALISYLFTLID